MVLSRAALGLVLALPLAAAAYESVETDTINTPDQGGHGSISAVLDGRSGNTDREAYTVGGRADYRSRETDMFVLVEHSHATALTPEQEVEDSSWAHAHYRDEFKHALAAEAFVDARKDDFQLLDLRTQFGLGARFTLNYEQDVRAVYAGIGVLHEWEDQANQDDHYWRLNPYFTYKRQVNEQLRVLTHLAYQPRLDDGDDYLVAAELALLVKLSTHVDLKLGGRWQYDSEAPMGIESDDTRYLTSLKLHF
jgi:putative salt-induced outer membrane protein YdiY